MAAARPLAPDAADNEVITTVTGGGPTYPDVCLGEDVGYWGWYCPNNDFGLRHVGGREGVFSSNRFYRAAIGVFDIHIWTRTDPVTPGPGDGDGDGDGDSGDGDGDPGGDGDGDGTGESGGDGGGTTAGEGDTGTGGLDTGPGIDDEGGCACSTGDRGADPRGGLAFALGLLLAGAGAHQRRRR